MKKKITIVASVIVGALILGLGIYQSSASQGSPKLSSDDIRQMVLDQYPGVITEIEFETDFNKAIYEVEVVSHEKEYDLKLDGNTGEVLKLKEKSISKTEKEEMALDSPKNDDNQKNSEEHESNDSDSSSKVENKNNKNESTQGKENKVKDQKDSHKKTVIDSKKAIEIAQEAFDGVVTELGLDKEDGRLIYEIELKSNNEEAEIDVDAYTGEILVIEVEIDKSRKYRSDKTLIDAQKAIDIALGEFDGIIYDLELEKEDGRLIYEVELKSRNEEAEVEIDAYSGEILKIEID